MSTKSNTYEIKIKYLGIFYTFIFSILHQLMVYLFLVLILGEHPHVRFDEMLRLLDIGIPVAIISALWLGSPVGRKVIIDKRHAFSVSYTVILKSVIMIFTITTLLFGLEEVIMDGGDHFDDLIVWVGTALILSLFGNIIPTVLSAMVMGYFMTKHRS